MRKLTTTALGVFCSFVFTFSLAGCDGAGGKIPASEGASAPAASGAQEDPAENRYPEVELSEGIYYVEVFTTESDPGDNPSALDSARMIGATLLWTDLPNLAEGRNLYVAFTGMETVNGADARVYAVSLGSEFDPQDYAGLYYLAADNDGTIYSMPGDAPGEWEPWQTTWEIETGVLYIDRPEIEELALGSEPDFYPLGLDRAMYIWKEMKEHGTPGGTTGRDILFRLIDIEYREDDGEDLFTCVYSVELDYGDGAEPLFWASINIGGKIRCDWGEGWRELPYGDMLGGEFAALPDK